MKGFIPALCFLLFTISLPSQTLTLPEGFVMEPDYITGLSEPTDLRFAPDGRIFITEKGGAVRIVEHGILLDDPFYSVSTQTPNERGLDGIALDPDFDLNGYVYLFYTLPYESRNVLTRVTSAGNTALPGSETELFRFDDMWASWHNGGGIVFDTAGKIIVGCGDGMSHPKAQDMNYTNGKMFRLNADGSIPADNPFYTVNTGIHRGIAAYGVRNPYTMDVSRISGKIFFNDVGNASFEEVNEFISGKNYGWAAVEGMLGALPAPDSNYMDPVYVYNHTFGCAVVGAAFYEPGVVSFPAEYFGKYFFMEYCEGKILCMDPDSFDTDTFATGIGYSWNNLETGPDGSLYLINVNTGKLGRIIYTGVNAPPLITQHPQSVIAAVGDTVMFSAASSGDSLTFNWYRNSTLVQSGPSASFNIENVQMTDSGSAVYVQVTNPHGLALSDTAMLAVINGSRPVITFSSFPADYAAGDSIHFAASVSDADQVAVPPAHWTWMAQFHHDEHTHPVMSATSGVSSGAVYVETHSEADTNVFFRILLEAQDSSGLVASAYMDVHPRKVTIHIQSTPSGVAVRADGTNLVTNADLRSVENLSRIIEVPPYHIGTDSLYSFLQWQDGADTLLREFSAGNDTFSLTYLPVNRYFHGLPEPGNLFVYQDTGSAQVFYKSQTVYQIRENWDVLNPYRWDLPPFPEDYWSARWEGVICPPVTGIYTLYLLHDSKVSLKIGDSLVLNGAVAPPSEISTDTISLSLDGGDSMKVTLWYDHYEYVSRVELNWAYAVVGKHTIPFQVCAPAVEIHPAVDESGITIFPNPSGEDVLNIRLDEATYIGQTLSLELYSMSGDTVASCSVRVRQPVHHFDTGVLPAGLYLARVQAGEAVHTFRYVKF